MPDVVNYVILGVVQGITEFLPISSDGHLVILSRWLKTPGDQLTLVVLLHLGSLAAIMWAFRRELGGIVAQVIRRGRGHEESRGEPRLLGLIVLASLPVFVIGYFLHSFFLGAFESPSLTGAMLVLTGIILLATRAFPEGRAAPNSRTAIVMGIAQVFALLPGLSRSALTLSAGFALGAERRQVARFSFLMAIPAIAGANALELGDLGRLRTIDPAGVVVGVAAAFLASLAAIRVLLALVRRGRFEWFGVYCVAAGLMVLSLLRLDSP